MILFADTINLHLRRYNFDVYSRLVHYIWDYLTLLIYIPFNTSHSEDAIFANIGVAWIAV